MKPYILFDIDGTLLNTKKTLPNFVDSVSKMFNIHADRYMQQHDAYYKTLEHPHDFYPKDYLRWLSEKLDVNVDKLYTLYFSTDAYTAILYPEVSKVLGELATFCTLGIFSEGFEDYQTQKLKLSGIDHFFPVGNRFIFRRKLQPDAVGVLPSGSIVVDDNAEVFVALQNIENITPIWLNRKSAAADSARVSISTLLALVELAKNSR